jgi:hypothetical protein
MPKLREDDKNKICISCCKIIKRKKYKSHYEDWKIYQARKFCNFNCMRGCIRMDKWKKNIISEHQGNWRANRLFNKKLICNICKNKKQQTDIHHIDGNNKNNELNNLIEICRSCHNKIHTRKNQKSSG